MSYNQGETADNYDLKFLELQKLQAFPASNTEQADNLTVNNVAISNQHQLIFTAQDNVIKAICLSETLNYEYSKTAINQTVESFPYLSTSVQYNVVLMTTSGGENNVLLVFGLNNGFLMVEAFDVASIASGQQLAPFARLNLNQSISYCTVNRVDWHPDFHQSLLVAALSNGIMISIGVNLEARNIQLLATYQSNSNITSLCWSPKGKQLVVGKEDGSLTQLKHFNGVAFQEAKTIQPPKEFPCKVLNVQWVLSSLFVVAYLESGNTPDPSTKYVIVSAPPKALPSFYDFGPMVLNSDVTGINRVDFCQIGFYVLCLSFTSSEVGVLGVENPEVTSAGAWKQFILEDSSRIELPWYKGSVETFPRGIGFFRSCPKVFVISEHERYGGSDCPLLFVLTSAGVLAPYCVIDKSKKLSIPVPGPPQQVAYVITQDTSLPPPPSSSPPQYQQQHQINPPVEPSPAVATVTEIEEPANPPPPAYVAPPSTMATTAVQDCVESTSAKMSSSQMGGDEPRQVTKEQVEDATFKLAIRDEIKEFSQEFMAAKNRFNEILSQSVGTEEERMQIVTKTAEAKQVLKSLEEAQLELDIDTLQGFLLESFATAEEGRCRVSQEIDERYRELLSKRGLNPGAARTMKRINETSKYIEIQLREVEKVLDHEWREKVDKKKSIVQLTSYETLLKLLSNNQKTIMTMKSIISDVEQQVLKKRGPSLRSKEDISNLVEAIMKTKLDTSFNEDSFLEERKTIEVKVLTEDKRKRLWEILEQRTSVPVVRAGPVPVDVNSSRFLSAVVKAEKKLEKIRQRKASKGQASGSKEQKPPSTGQNSIPQATGKTRDVTSGGLPCPQVQVQMVKPTSQTARVTIKPVAVVGQAASPSASVVKPSPVANFQTIQRSKPQNQTQQSSTVSSSSAPKPAPIKSSTESGQTVGVPLPATTVASTKPPPSSQTQTVPFTKPTASKVTSFVPVTTATTTGSIKPTSFTPAVESKSLFGPKSGPGFSFQFNPSAVSTPATTESKSSSSSFKFGLQSDASKPFAFATKENESKPKYEDITPPTSPEPKPSSEAKPVTQERPKAVTSAFAPPKESAESLVSSKSIPSTGTSFTPLFGAAATTKSVTTAEPDSSSVLITSAKEKPSDSGKAVETVSSATVSSASEATTAVTTITSLFGTSTVASSATPFWQKLPASTATSTSTAVSTSTTTVAAADSSKSTAVQPSFGAQSHTTSTGQGSLFGQSQGVFSQGFQSASQTSTAPPVSTPTPAFGQSVAPTTASSTGISAFSAPVSSAAAAATPSGSFGTTFSFCNLGGQPNPENVNKNPFGSVFGAGTASSGTPNLFGTQTTTSSLFGSPVQSPTQSSFGSGTGVAQSGFGAFQEAAQATPKFGAAPTFGGSPGGFGGSPIFGGSPAFGAAPTFGSGLTSGLGGGFSSFQQTASANASNAPFGNFAAASELPTFGAIAQQSPPAFGQQQQQQAQQPQQQSSTPAFGFGGGFSGFGSPQPQQQPSFSAPQFSQRRQ